MAVSQSSIAIDSFLEYFKDAKPYHTKLLEVIEEYNFSEDMCVLMCEQVDKEITIQNEPLCKLTGFGIDYDDTCGYDAIDCCDLFDCIGGYGYIFDNSDLLIEESIEWKDDDYGILSVTGNQISDTFIPVTSVFNSKNFVLEGDATDLLDKHAIAVFVNVLQFDIISNTSDSMILEGDHTDFINSKTSFNIEGTDTQYNGRYTVRSVSYDAITDQTTLDFVYFKNIPNDALLGEKVQFRNSNPNGGIYYIDSFSYDGTQTFVTIKNDDFNEINPGDYRLGSFQFRTGLRYPREIEIDPLIVEYHNILYSEYDYTNNRTNIYVDGDISEYNIGDTIKLYGYFFGSGYDGDAECTKPKDSHISSKLEENLFIEIDDSLIVQAPTPTPSIGDDNDTPTPILTPSVTPTNTPTPTPSISDSATPTPTPTPSTSSSTDWTPAEITTDLWLDADDESTITLDGSGNVEQWDDKSGNIRHYAQATASKRPAKVSAVLNGLPVLRFTKVDQKQLTAAYQPQSPYHIFLVVRAAANTNGGIYSSWNSTSTTVQGATIGIGGTTMDNSGANAIGVKEGVVWHPTTQSIVSASGELLEYESKTSGADIVIVNAVDAGATGSGSVIQPTTGVSAIGGWQSGNNARFPDVDIAEAVLIEGTASTVDREKIEGYLAHKWGLEGDLPAGHPYKSSPP